MRLIDISLVVDEGLPVWPGDPAVAIERFLDMNKGDGVNASRLSLSAHTGTHVDAPRHHFAGGPGADELRLDDLIGSAVVAEVTGTAVVDVPHLDGLGLAPGVQRLLLKTDNGSIWDEGRHAFRPEFVALTPAAAEWLVAHGIRLVGVDYMSVERFGAARPDVHRTLLAAGVVLLEGLDLRKVRPGVYQLICLPLRLRGLDGAPARAVLVDERDTEAVA